MPAFRQVGEKQLPNPVLCMAWSPKRDLIALANTTGEVGLKSFIIPETCFGIMYSFLIVWLMFGHSCCYTAWLVSSVFGAYLPVSALGKRSLHLPGDLMAKVRNDSISLLASVFLLMEAVHTFYPPFYSPVLAFSLGDTKQVVLCGVEKAEILHVFPMQHPVTCMHWMEVTEENRYLWGSQIKSVAQRMSDFKE